MNKLLIATTNPAKIAEYKKLLATSGMEMVTPQDVGITEKPPETGKTFEENAIIKTRFYSQKTGLPALADDGGLEVEALHGEPGLHTGNMSDEEIIADVINRMKDIPEGKRQCKLSVALALSSPFGIMTSFSDVSGVVAVKPSDKRVPGYPYRSVIYLPKYEKYHVDLSDEEYEILNHRQHALWKINDMFKDLV